MLNEYIKELIASNNRVIIPNFGAFLLRATSKNKNKKDLASKIDDIYFSPFLKFNDELLVNHIMKKEDLDQKKALDKINEYIKSIEASVNKEGIYQIEGLGEFYQDAQGKIQFRINPSSEEGKEEKSTETKSEETKGKTSKPEAEKTAKKTIHEKAAASGKKESSKAEPAKAKEAPKKEAPREATQKQEKQKAAAPKTEKQKAAPASSSTASGSAVKSSEKKKTNKGLVLSIAIGLPIAAIFIWAMLNFDTVKNIFSSKEQSDQVMTEKVEKEEKTGDEGQEGKQPQGEETSKDQDEDKEMSQDQSRKQEETTAGKSDKTEATTKEKKFYIVAGSFRKKQNAVNFRDKLREQGYNSELIGERNGMHAVSYSSFKSKTKAKAELSMFRRKGIQAWLLYY